MFVLENQWQKLMIQTERNQRRLIKNDKFETENFSFLPKMIFDHHEEFYFYYFILLSLLPIDATTCSCEMGLYIFRNQKNRNTFIKVL
jgi:hypothetical protein